MAGWSPRGREMSTSADSLRFPCDWEWTIVDNEEGGRALLCTNGDFENPLR